VDHLDPSAAAYYALIAVCLVVLGGALTGDLNSFSIEARGTVIGALVAVLGYVAWRAKRKNGGES